MLRVYVIVCCACFVVDSNIHMVSCVCVVCSNVCFCNTIVVAWVLCVFCVLTVVCCFALFG